MLESVPAQRFRLDTVLHFISRARCPFDPALRRQSDGMGGAGRRDTNVSKAARYVNKMIHIILKNCLRTFLY